MCERIKYFAHNVVYCIWKWSLSNGTVYYFSSQLHISWSHLKMIDAKLIFFLLFPVFFSIFYYIFRLGLCVTRETIDCFRAIEEILNDFDAIETIIVGLVLWCVMFSIECKRHWNPFFSVSVISILLRLFKQFLIESLFIVTQNYHQPNERVRKQFDGLTQCKLTIKQCHLCLNRSNRNKTN